MSKKNIFLILSSYKKVSSKKRKAYLDNYREKMAYRTTKTENPETTRQMVKKVLYKAR